MIARELALTLATIEDTRRLYARLEEDVGEAECRAGTRLMQLHDLDPELPPGVLPVDGDLLRLGAELRRLRAAQHEQLTTLRFRLLSLLGKYTQLTFDDD